jgi:trk system potassium uptake protein TrkH
MAAPGLVARRRRRTVRLSPPAVLMALYAALILAGTILLRLPISAHAPTGWYDALFTAASAVTVTGLVVVDTGTHYTAFGQLIIMVLIQLGGLGLMTFAVLVFALLGLHLPLRHQLILSEDLNQTDLGNLMWLAWLILRVVAVLELIGVALLALRFVPEFGWREGMWQALFHAISAFNNAGFGLFSDSLSRWVGDPLINLVVPGLFIVGGIGYAVLADLGAKRRWRPLTLHSKLMLSGTGALIVWSMAGFLMLEWSNPATLGGLDGIGGRLWAGWFQAVTTRTAGFNTVEIGKLWDSTALLVITLMVIGGGSTSTAGGIKVTTFVVLLLETVAFLKRRDVVSAFERSLPPGQLLKVMALVVISLLVIVTGLFIVLATNHQPFLDLAFEVVSAFGTVGLSRGVTADLDPVGRAAIVAIMFMGRVGPLALGFFLATRTAPRVRYPSGEVYLG